MKRILVTGATGFIGIEISRQLASRGLKPRLMVRRPLRGLMLKHMDVEIMQADLRSPRSLLRAVDGIDTIFHLGARAAFESYTRLYPSIVGGSKNLMLAAVASGVRQVVYGGSLMVYPDSSNEIDQDIPPKPLSGYGRAKLAAEKHLQAIATDGGTRFVSLRLPHVYGAHSLLFDQVRHGRVFFPGKADNPFAHLHVADAARAMIRAAEIGLQGCWVIADDQSCTWNDFFETVSTYYPRMRTTHIPRNMAYVGAKLLDFAFPLVGQQNPYPSGAISCWNLSLPVISGTLKDVLGIHLKYASIHDGIPAVLDDAISFYWLPSNLDRV